MKKFAIMHSGNEIRAIEILTEFLLDYTLEEPVCFKYGESLPAGDAVKIYLGRSENLPKAFGSLSAHPQKEQGYAITVKNGDVYIEGFDAAGLLYGCIDLYNKYLLKLEYPHNPDRYVVSPFSSPLPDFELVSSPSVENRGIWTWGHVIYDYRRFIDNMVKLKLNRLIIWNDFVPVNACEIISYAHERQIKIFFGYPWCWDTNCAKFNLDEVFGTSQDVLNTYLKNFSDLGLDGIYFQSFTELKQDKIGGILIADAVSRYVNRTASLFFERFPDLELQFGLHATSVKDRLEFIKNVNPQIKIVWEDCGAFPFSYLPSDIENFEQTCNFVREIAVLREESERFGAVTKGFTKLDWGAFEHPLGSSFIGKASDSMKQNRIVRKEKIWKYLQAYWLTNAGKAQQMVKLMSDLRGGNLDICALVEDGMFEENIMFPVALYSEFLWDCDSDVDKTTNEVALRSYVTFA